jgi:Uma2 family endonuclease
MSTVQIPSHQRFLLPSVPWRSYERMLRAFADRPGVRLTYDRGVLEIMTLSHGHENRGHLLGRFVVVLTEELGLPLKSGGSTTLRRRKRRRGLEPDECYWVANEALVRDKDVINLLRDPAPDLAMEIDITHSSLDRLGIYAALGVPEIWRFDGQHLTFHVLGADGQYSAAESSLTFPQLTPADLLAFLNLRGQMDENAVVRQFRTWVRQRFGDSGKTTKA